MNKSIIHYGIILSFCLCSQATEYQYDVHKALEVENSSPAVIIGAGPAGLAAALYCVRGGFKPTVVGGGKFGGQLTRSHLVENVLGYGKQSGKDIMKTKIEHLETFDVQMIHEQATRVDLKEWPFTVMLGNGDTIRALSLVITTGSTPKLLDVPGEATYFGHGVSTCADCDAHFFEGDDVVVVGGGDSAIIYALVLSSFAKSVTVLNRSGKLRAAPTVSKHLKEYDTIKILLHKKVVEIGGDGEVMKHVIIEDTQTGERSQLSVQGLFLAIGHKPNTKIFDDGIEKDSHGSIVVKGRGQETSLPGVFAAGEASPDPYRQVMTAEGDGAKAGMQVVNFLHEIGLNEKLKHELKLYHYEPLIEEDEYDLSDGDEIGDDLTSTKGEETIECAMKD